jgi:phytoene dehydrogenase-like protein
VRERVLAVHVVTAPDIEEWLGLTEGDLDGGEIAPDQVFSLRPWAGMETSRTQIAGFYLAGPSAAPSPFLLGAAASRTASAVIADFKGGRLG